MILATFKGTVTAIQPIIDEAGVQQLAMQTRQDLEAAGTFTTDLFWTTYNISRLFVRTLTNT